MQTLSEIKALLTEHGLSPRHRFGQNFLHDKNQLAKLIDAADVKHRDLILEVGPGTGTLTEALVERGAEVIAVEIDRDLAAITRGRLGDRITLIEGDVIESGRKLNRVVIEALGDRSFKLVANLPYQIASPLMSALLIDHSPFSRDAQRSASGGCVGQFVTIQKEVADRLLASPSTKEYGPLTIIVRAFADVKKIAALPPTSFWPPPKVASAIVSIASKPSPLVESRSDRESLARFITDLFSKRRKQLRTIFGREASARILPPGVRGELRPEALMVDQLIDLYRRFTSESGHPRLV